MEENVQLYHKYDETVAKSLEYISKIIKNNGSINITNYNLDLKHHLYVFNMLFLHHTVYNSDFRINGDIIKLIKLKRMFPKMKFQTTWFKKNSYNFNVNDDFVYMGTKELLSDIYDAYYKKGIEINEN